MKVHVVTTGEYSAYTVRGVCSTWEKAKAASLLWIDGNEPLTLEIDDVPIQPDGHELYSVRGQRSGELIAELVDDCFEDVSDLGAQFYQRPAGRFGAVIWARDATHAIKIASDIRREMIANNETRRKL